MTSDPLVLTRSLLFVLSGRVTGLIDGDEVTGRCSGTHTHLSTLHLCAVHLAVSAFIIYPTLCVCTVNSFSQRAMHTSPNVIVLMNLTEDLLPD